MGAIEPARQAGSTDTKLDQQLDHDGFAVGSLVPGDKWEHWRRDDMDMDQSH